MDKMRRAGGLVAAILIVFMGLGLLSVSPLVGVSLLLLGAAGMVWQGQKLYAERADPYDLSKLWERDEDPDEPDEVDTEGHEDTMLCHHCGHAVPRPFARCPECGLQLR